MKNLTAEKILSTLATHADELRGLGVRKIGLFGSRLREQPHSGSDIDLVVALADHSFDTYMDVQIYLEDLFEVKIDLVPEAAIREELRPHIMDEVVYAQGV
jgi:hypothetical protein